MTLTPQWAVVSAAVFLVVCASMASRIPLEAVATREHRHVLHDVRSGLSALWSTKGLQQVVVVSTIAHAGFGAFVVATPLMAHRWTGHAEAGALLLTVYAAGALAGTAVLARRPIRHSPERVVVWAAAAVGLCLSLAAWSPNMVVATVLYAIAGVADGPLLVGTFAVRHRDAPVAVRSQVFTTAASLKIGAYAVGVAAAGMLSAGGVELLLLAAALHLGAAATSPRGPRVSRRSAVPSPAADPGDAALSGPVSSRALDRY
jgi:predicted MFS family arabinose efflux permease